MGFKAEVDDVLPGAYEQGLKALKGNSGRIQCADSRQLVGSVYLDEAVEGGRWDYGIGVRRKPGKEEVYWVEVHSASSKNVREMLEKLDWLKTWLANEAPALRAMTAKGGYVWLAARGVDIPKGSRQARLLIQAGLAFPRTHLRIE